MGTGGRVRPQVGVRCGIILPQLHGTGVELDTSNGAIGIVRRGRQRHIDRRDEHRVHGRRGQGDRRWLVRRLDGDGDRRGGRLRVVVVDRDGP